MTLRRVGTMLAVIALATLLAGTAWADEAKPAETKPAEKTQPGATDIRIQMGAGGQPTVRMWIDGQEVRPGDALPKGIGQIKVESMADPGHPGKAKAKAKAKTEGGAKGGAEVHAKTHARVEVKAEGDADQPTVRMWVNGREVQPDGGGDGRIRMWVQGKEVAAPRPDDGDGPPRGALGVRVAALTDDLAGKVGVEAGVAVLGVMEGSPAAKAGLREGDVITHVDGRAVRDPQAVVEAVSAHRPGQTVRLRWQRPDHVSEKAVRLGDRDALMEEAATGPRREGDRDERAEEGRNERREGDREQPEGRKGGFLGVLAAPLTDDMREISGAKSGALINSLTDDSPAAKAGLKPGDVIIRVGTTDVKGVEGLVGALEGRRPGEKVPVVFYRMGKKMDTRVTLGRRPGEEGDREEAKKEGAPLFDLPEGLFGEAPDIREYLKGLQPQMEEWLKKFSKQEPKWQDRPAPGKKPQPYRIQPTPPRVAPQPKREPYDLGKDMGRLMERLDRIEKRLDEIEKRLDRVER